MTEERPAPASDEHAAAAEASDQSDPEAPTNEDDTDDIVEEAATPHHVAPEGSRGKRSLAAVSWLLASILVLFAGVAVWAHQTLLTADGWGGIVEEVIADEEVTDALAIVVVDRLADSLDVADRVADALPGPDIIAGAITNVVQDRITDALASFAQGDRFQEAFVNANTAAHTAAIAAIRGGDREALTSEDGVIALNIFPLFEGVLQNLQDAGLIDASRQIPDLSSFEPSDRAVALIEQVLGRDIPDDAGTIVLVDSESLAQVQTVVRWFDGITLVSLVLWVLFTGLALWLAQKRIRMVLWLSGGAIAALLAARVTTRLLLEAATRRQPELEARVVVSAIIDTAVDSLLLWTFALILVAIIVAIAAVVYERRDRLQRASLETPPRTLGRWVRDNAAIILVLGLGLIAVLAVWSIGGAGIGMLTASAILLLVIGVKVLADQAGDESAEIQG